jgi:hypothetical protein
LVNRLSILAAGVNPAWVRQTSTFDDPPVANDAGLGIDCSGALVTGVRIRTRENPTVRTCRVTVTTFVGDGDGTFEVDGTTYATTGAPYADAEELFTDVVGALAAENPRTATGVGPRDDAAHQVQTVDVADLSYGFTGDGTDVFVVTADCESAAVRFFSMASGTDETAEATSYWDFIQGSDTVVDLDGFSGPLLEVGQCLRLYGGATCTKVTGDGGELLAQCRMWFGVSNSTTPAGF